METAAALPLTNRYRRRSVEQVQLRPLYDQLGRQASADSLLRMELTAQVLKRA